MLRNAAEPHGTQPKHSLSCSRPAEYDYGQNGEYRRAYVDRQQTQQSRTTYNAEDASDDLHLPFFLSLE